MSDNQVSFATLGNAVGFVVQISGSVRVQSIDGQERIVNVGDPIFYGETVIAIGNGSATIEFVDGNQIVVANEAVVEITDEVFSFGDAQELVADSSVDFDELQQAILEGQDPTLIQDAPAAGNDGTDDGDSDRVDVSINRSGQEALPSYGYDTDNSRDVDTGGSAYYGRETAPDPFAFATSSTTNNTSASSSASTTPLTINLDIDPITTDSIVNAAEAADNVTVTGSVTGDAFTSGTVQLTVNGTVYTGTVVNGGFSISVAGSDLANDADAIVDGSVQVSNSAGQTGQASSSQSYAVDVTATAGTVTVDDITSDDVINASEAAGTVTVTGTATGGDIAEGDTVTLEINGNIYTTTVAAGGTWSVDVAGTDLAADTAFDVSVESDDASGNSVVSNGSSTHTVDTTASAGIDIDTITSDSILNASETTNGNIVTVSGWVSGDAKAGDTVQIVLDDAVIAETVVSSQTDSLGRLTYSVGVLGSVLASTSSANPYITAKVSGTDVAGNSFSVTSTEIYKVDTWADIEVFAQDGNGDLTVNYDEQGSLLIGGFTETASTVTALTISDSAGNSISIPLADISYTDSDGWGYFEANVDVTGLLDGVLTVNASVSDAVGNVAYAAPSTIQKDTVADQGTVTVDNITSDDMISLDESQQVLPVTGTAIGGDIAEGDTLTLEVNGTKYTTLVGVDGHWSVDVQGSDLLADTEISVVVNSSDSVGNTVKSFGYSTHSVVAPVVSIAADQTNVTEGGTAGFTV
ncbi:retention module-containing protein, partial [Rhodanobacter aciditrophus]